MTKEEIFKNKFEYVVLPNREDVLDCMQEYADQETERLKAELVKTIETAKATSVTQRQHIERLQNELNELKEKHNMAIDLVDKVKNYQTNKVTANELYKLADKILQTKI